MIKMIAGVYGLPIKQDNGKTRVVGMGPNSGPFSTDPAREAELVARKLAVYVNEEPVDEPAPVDEYPDLVDEDGEPIGFDETPADDEEEGEPEEEKPLEAMTANELRELGKEYGLTFKVGMKKVDMIEAIKAEFPVPADEEEPTFDPAEAVI